MPLIVITGVPCSGKTTRTFELQKFFEEQGKDVHIVSEQEQIFKAGFDKNALYSDSNKEKHIRGLLKSEVLRLISSNNVVIFDGLNYIKGYRYELYCGSKASKCTQCTIHTEINREQAWEFNENRGNEKEKYDKPTFEALLMRYEDPDGKNRWDSPLFTIFPEQAMDKNAIFTCLYKKKPPRPNMSTQNAPLSDTNFLYDLDKETQKIVDHLVKCINNGDTGQVVIPEHDGLTIDISNTSIQQLMILKRQYITYSKMHAPDPKQVAHLFIQYLATSVQ